MTPKFKNQDQHDWDENNIPSDEFDEIQEDDYHMANVLTFFPTEGLID